MGLPYELVRPNTRKRQAAHGFFLAVNPNAKYAIVR